MKNTQISSAFFFFSQILIRLLFFTPLISRAICFPDIKAAYIPLAEKPGVNPAAQPAKNIFQIYKPL